MVELVFWSACFWIAWVNVGYALLLLVWSRLAPRPILKRSIEPTVSIVVALHNERKNVAARLRNCLELDYPAEKLQVIVSLDAPTDGTDLLLEEYAGKGVTVLLSAVRKGKADAINRGIAAATGEIVLLADARQRFDRNVVRELVANFADESVGVVSGELIILDGSGAESGDAVGLYWRYEKALRSMESAIHSVPGSTGAITAIRRDLYRPLPAGTILDDVITPMNIVLQGKRAVFEPAARAYDRANQRLDREFVRKLRTLTGNYELLVEMPELLLPWRNPIALQFVSHKAGRLLVPWCMASLLISSSFPHKGVYVAVLFGQILFYLTGFAGWLIAERTKEAQPQGSVARLALAVYAFLLMNWAAAASLFYFLRGHEGFWNAIAAGGLASGKERV
jgi:biofilm PGA synthesis N-glycosyltransferase PgaC